MFAVTDRATWPSHSVSVAALAYALSTMPMGSPIRALALLGKEARSRKRAWQGAYDSGSPLAMRHNRGGRATFPPARLVRGAPRLLTRRHPTERRSRSGCSQCADLAFTIGSGQAATPRAIYSNEAIDEKNAATPLPTVVAWPHESVDDPHVEVSLVRKP